jgi:hypothetical protein
MVTAELACALPVLAIILAVALSAVAVEGQAVRAQDAARELARSVARGDATTGRTVAGRLAPTGRAGSTTSGDQVTATVSIVVHPLGGWLPSVTVHASAVAALEPDAALNSNGVSP